MSRYFELGQAGRFLQAAALGFDRNPSGQTRLLLLQAARRFAAAMRKYQARQARGVA